MFMLVVLTGIASSCKYDDEELWDYVTDLADRISTLETLTKQMNYGKFNINSMHERGCNKDDCMVCFDKQENKL